jgi:hypothetical protein
MIPLRRHRAEHDQFPLVADFVEPEDVHAIVIRSDFELMGSSARGSARSVAGPVLAANIHPRSVYVVLGGGLYFRGPDGHPFSRPLGDQSSLVETCNA